MKTLLLFCAAVLAGAGLACAQEEAEKEKAKPSLADLAKEPEYPLWARPAKCEFTTGKPGAVFGSSNKNATEMKRNTGRLRYLVENSVRNPDRPFLMLQLGRHFADLGQDAAAYGMLKQLLDLPADTPHDRLLAEPTLTAVQDKGRFYLARVLARNGLKDEASAELAKLGPADGYQEALAAEILMLAGDAEGAAKKLESVKGDGHPERGFSDAFLRMRAGLMARALGRSDLFTRIAAPITGKAQNSQKWPQWQAAWAVLHQLEQNAKSGISPEFDKLKDGEYSGSCHGFVSDIAVKVTVKDKQVSEIKVLRHQENRPWSATEELPKRLLKQKSFKVDCVTGATVTSGAIVAATDAALLKAAK